MQTAYEEQKRAFPGMKGNLNPDRVGTLTSLARHPFGFGIVLSSAGSDKEQIGKLPALAADITDLKSFRGVALHSHTVESVDDSLAPGYRAKTPISVLEKGDAWVVLAETVAPTDPVYLVFSGADAGKFAKSALTATAALVPNARFRSVTETVDGVMIALVELY